MAKGFCAECKTQLGGIGKPKGYVCPACGRMYCKTCSPTRGLFNNPYCPDCGRKLIK